MKLAVWRNAKFERYIFVILLCIELIMSFTFLGYIHIPPISVTTAYIPIVAAACLFGPWEAAVAGLLFGLGSVFKASALYVLPDDQLFSPFRSGAPVKSLLLSVGARVLFGILIGWLFRLAKGGRLRWLWMALLALAANRLHALLVYGAIWLLFPERGLTLRAALRLDPSTVFISVLCLFCVLLCSRLYGSKLAASCRSAINSPESKSIWSPKVCAFLGVITAFILSMAICSAVYFSSRTNYMMAAHGVIVSGDIRHDILLLQTQVLLSMLSLCLILLLVILMIYRYMKYKEYVGEMDALTDVMGRRLFLNHCAQCQKRGGDGWFLFLDVDRFKEINDTFGHSVGDETLKAVAAILKELFQDCGAVGRVGGDEFAALLDAGLTRAEVETLLNGFLTEIAALTPERPVSCSIGAYHFLFPKDVTELLTRTDHALYQAKANGRACFVILDELAPSPLA